MNQFSVIVIHCAVHRFSFHSCWSWHTHTSTHLFPLLIHFSARQTCWPTAVARATSFDQYIRRLSHSIHPSIISRCSPNRSQTTNLLFSHSMHRPFSWLKFESCERVELRCCELRRQQHPNRRFTSHRHFHVWSASCNVSSLQLNRSVFFALKLERVPQSSTRRRRRCAISSFAH